MWSPTSRRQHSRAALRYGSDLTDAEWAILEPLLPPPCACPMTCPVTDPSFARESVPWRQMMKQSRSDEARIIGVFASRKRAGGRTRPVGGGGAWTSYATR